MENKNPPVTVTHKTVNDETLAYEAYARFLPVLEALRPEELVPINLDIPAGMMTALGALPEIQALRPMIEKDLPNFDLLGFDNLENYILVLHHSNSQYLSAVQPTDGLEELVEECTDARETLSLDAETLGRHGLLDKNRLKNLQGPVGYKNLASDLGVLASVLMEAWPGIQGKCAVEFADIERATKLGQRLMRIVGLREQGPAVIARAADIRVRAFTLMTRTYDDARRAVTYLRWHDDDFDKIAPSLYSGRSNGRRKVSTDIPPTSPTSPTSPAETKPNTPAPTPAPGGVASTTPAASGTDEDGPFVDES